MLTAGTPGIALLCSNKTHCERNESTCIPQQACREPGREQATRTSSQAHVMKCRCFYCPLPVGDKGLQLALESWAPSRELAVGKALSRLSFFSVGSSVQTRKKRRPVLLRAPLLLLQRGGKSLLARMVYHRGESRSQAGSCCFLTNRSY